MNKYAIIIEIILIKVINKLKEPSFLSRNKKNKKLICLQVQNPQKYQVSMKMLLMHFYSRKLNHQLIKVEL